MLLEFFWKGSERWRISQFVCSKSLFLPLSDSTRFLNTTKVLIIALIVTYFCISVNRSSSTPILIASSLDARRMFSAFLPMLLYPRDASVSFLPAALMTYESSVSSCSDVALLNKLRCSLLWCILQDLMFCDGSSWAIASARTLFLLKTQAERAPVCYLFVTFLSDRHGIRLVDHCRSLILPLCNSAYLWNYSWPICPCRYRNGEMW